MLVPQRFAAAILPDKDAYTEDEYFAFEEQSLGRWEFVPVGPPQPDGRRLGQIRAVGDCSPLGEIHAMSGGSPDHSAIAGNLITALNLALRAQNNQRCRVFTADLKVRCADGLSTFPDASIVCGSLNFYGRRRDIVTNPLVLAEVLSPSTEAFDRADKWLSYQSIPSLQHFLLVSATQPRVEVYTREEQGWHFEVVEGREASVSLLALGVTVTLSDLYALVDFTAEQI